MSISHFIQCAAFGWKPPLKNTEVEQEEIKVHSNGEILSGPEERESVSRLTSLFSYIRTPSRMKWTGTVSCVLKFAFRMTFLEPLLTRIVVAVITKFS